jgi:hypothetical protein
LIKDIVAKTGGKLSKAFDATGKNGQTIAPLFKQVEAKEKIFSSTSAW